MLEDGILSKRWNGVLPPACCRDMQAKNSQICLVRLRLARYRKADQCTFLGWSHEGTRPHRLQSSVRHHEGPLKPQVKDYAGIKGP